MFLLVLDSKLFLAPLEEPGVAWPTRFCLEWLLTVTQKVLDVGTGTGIWAMWAILHASNWNGKLMPS